MTARLIRGMAPGSPEWLRTISASKIPAIMRLNPPGWENRFSLWHKMAGLVGPDPPSERMNAGHYFENAVARRFADAHPDWQIVRTGCWQNTFEPWRTATPDRLIHKAPGGRRILECKYAVHSDPHDWGPSFTGEFPAHYHAQIMWQLDVLGLKTAHLAAETPRGFREYTIEHDPAFAAAILEEARHFIDTLPGGRNEQPPDIDGDTATYQTLRKLHPDIDDTDLELSDGDAALLASARVRLKQDEREWAHMLNTLTQRMGTAQRAVAPDGTVIARRQAKQGGTPYVVAAKDTTLTRMLKGDP